MQPERFAARRGSTVLPIWIVVLAVAVFAACAVDSNSPVTPEAPTSSRGAEKDLAGFLGDVGCRRHVGLPVWGTIGMPTATGRMLFNCRGVTGESMRAAHGRHRASLSGELRLASVAGGYTIRHYLGTREYCGTETLTTWSYNGRVTGKQTIVDYGSCVTVADFWDEWIPGEDDEPIPDDAGVGGEGGGPYYGPSAPPTKTPRMDTLPDTVDHVCDDQLDFSCLRPLSTRDRARIFDTLPLYLTPLSEILDTVVRAECDTLRIWYARAKEKDVIKAGRSDLVAPDRRPHWGQTRNGIGNFETPSLFHIDPRVLNNATSPAQKKQLWEAVFHEIGHAVGELEHSNDSAHVWNGYPGDRYFETVYNQICFKAPGT